MIFGKYRAKISYDPEDEVFCGEVLNINDSVNFYGSSVKELKKTFSNAIFNYEKMKGWYNG